MAYIREMEKIAKKWSSVTPQRSPDYAFGVANPRRSWMQATVAAEPAYEAGLQKSIAKKAFGKGAKKAGDEKWSRKTLSNGVTRWGPGVAAAEGDYHAGFAPYRDVIAKTVLPPRYARRDPRNLLRVEVIAKALGAEKERRLAAV